MLEREKVGIRYLETLQSNSRSDSTEIEGMISLIDKLKKQNKEYETKMEQYVIQYDVLMLELMN